MNVINMLTKGSAGISLTLVLVLTGCGEGPAAPEVRPPTGIDASVAAANGYRFAIVVDSDRDGFDPFGFVCPAMNEEGAIAFHGILASTFQAGIFRKSGPRVTTIALDQGQFGFIGVNPSINNKGDVSFAASASGGEFIFRGRGGPLTTIAETASGPFTFFGFDTSVDDAGNVAFKAELDNFDQGLFYGAGGSVTTVYLGSTSKFQGNNVGPAINNAGQIGFFEDLDVGGSGMFLWTGSGFITVATDGRRIGGFFLPPSINDLGVLAFQAFLSDGGEAVFKGGGGPLTTVASSRGAYSSFDFGGPSINDAGLVAFGATLDTGEQGVFVGPDPVANRVILAGDPLGGATTTNFVFCREGLNNRGQLAFLALLDDGRALIVRASPPTTVPTI